MVRTIGFEHAVVSQRVCVERVNETTQRPVHHKAVQHPLEKRGVDRGEAKAKQEPGEENVSCEKRSGGITPPPRK